MYRNIHLNTLKTFIKYTLQKIKISVRYNLAVSKAFVMRLYYFYDVLDIRK